MAVIGALRVDLAANIAKFEADMGKAAKQVAKVQRRFDQFGKRVMAAGQALSVGLTAPLVAVGALAARSFLSFEQGMNKVAAVSGATEAEMASLTAIAKDLGSTTSFSAAQAAEGLGFLAQAGFDATEAGKALPGVLQLAAAGGLQLAEAADIATNVLSGYGLEVDQLSRVNDVLAKASSSANTDVLQLGQAFKFAGPVARSAGISFEQSGAAMALMGNAGIQAEMAGTALRGAITKLVNPSKEAAGTMAELGISATDSEGRLRPLDEIIEQLAPHADNTGAIMQIFGQRAGPAMSALVSQGADALRDMTAALEQSGGTAQEIADKKLAGLTGAWTKLKSATEGVLIEIGDRLAPVLERIAAMLTDRVLPAVRRALDAFDRLSPGMKTAAVVGAGLAAALGPILIAFGGMVSVMTPALPILAKSAALMKLGAVAAGVLKAAFVVLTGPIGLVAGAIVALLASTKEGRAVLSATGALIKQVVVFAFAKLRDVVVGAGGKLAAFGQALVDMIPDWVLDSLDWLAEKIGAVGATLEGVNDVAADVDALSDLDQEMRDLAASGELTVDAMDRVAREAITLRDRGQELTVGLERLVTHFERTTGQAEQLQETLEAVASAPTISDLSNQTRRLAESGEASSEVMRVVAVRAEELQAAGGDLTEVLQNVVKAYGSATVAGETFGDSADDTASAMGRHTGSINEQAAAIDALVAKIQRQTSLDQVNYSAQKKLTEDLAALSRRRSNAILGYWTRIGAIIKHQAQSLKDQQMAAFNNMNALVDNVRALADQKGRDMIGDAVKRAEQYANSFRGRMGSILTPENIGAIFVRAFEGGGAALGAVQSLATQLGTQFSEYLGNKIGDFGGKLGGILNGMLGAMLPMIGPVFGMLAGKIWSGIKRLFGGPSQEELARRDVFAEFHAGISADVKGMAEYQKVLQMHLSHGWDRTLAEVSAAFSAVGQSAGLSHDEAMAHYKTFQDAVKSGNKDQMLSVIAMYETWLGTSAMATGQMQQDFDEFFTGVTAEQAPKLTEAMIEMFEKARAAGAEFAVAMRKMFAEVGEVFTRHMELVETTATETWQLMTDLATQAVQGIIAELQRIPTEIRTTVVVARTFAQPSTPVGGAIARDIALNLPHLATGGLATRPTLAVIGERGPEVVAPFDRLESIIGGADRGTASDRPVVIQVRLPDDTLLVEHIVRRVPEVLEALGRA